VREERTEAAGSSPPPSFGKRGRKSAGSRTGAAKSRDRWRVCARGRRAKVRRPSRHSSVEGALGRSEPFSLTRGRGRRSRRCVTGRQACARRDGGVRGRHARLVRGRQRRGTRDATCGPALRSGARQDRVASAPAGSWAATADPSSSAGRVKRDRTQLGMRRQTHRDPGRLLGRRLHRTWPPRESAGATSGIGRSVEVHMSRVGCRSR
jgi:hypothetical protein